MINSKLAIVRSFGSMNVVDLKNATILKQNNFAFDDVWQFSPSIMFAKPYPMGICATVNPLPLVLPTGTNNRATGSGHLPV